MSEPVLERSVLERKERDELQTIAKALGAKPPARAKKADLVDLILATAGITSPVVAEPAPSRNGEGRVKAEPAPEPVAIDDDADADVPTVEEVAAAAEDDDAEDQPGQTEVRSDDHETDHEPRLDEDS